MEIQVLLDHKDLLVLQDHRVKMVKMALTVLQVQQVQEVYRDSQV
jgi:hypothetical protein